MKIGHFLPIALLLVAGIARAQGQEPKLFHADGVTETAKAGCSAERWAVKTMSDSAATLVEYQQVATEVSKLCLEPSYPEVTATTPRIPNSAEQKEYWFWGYLYAYKLEEDGDLHMLIVDMENDSTIIAEVPNPDCPEITNENWRRNFRDSRQVIFDKFGQATTNFKYLATPRQIQVIGVEFYNLDREETDRAANGLEIHPVTDIKIFWVEGDDDQ